MVFARGRAACEAAGRSGGQAAEMSEGMEGRSAMILYYARRFRGCGSSPTSSARSEGTRT
eukprot:4126087-Heterocapsa_arctica.AAC.1